MFRLKNEHVGKVFDVGRLPSGAPYMVLELLEEDLEGENLETRIVREGKIDPIQTIQIARQVATAIDEAHGLGIVHRDLKPENIFLTKQKDAEVFVKVLDFGISKCVEDVDMTGLTQTAAILGTPRFMAPEQLESSSSVDARADIWSLGGVLYRMLTGKYPIEGATLVQLIAAVHRKESIRPPHLLEPGTPRWLSALVMKCLRHDREERFANAGALLAALEQGEDGSEALEEEDSTTSPNLQ